MSLKFIREYKVIEFEDEDGQKKEFLSEFTSHYKRGLIYEVGRFKDCDRKEIIGVFYELNEMMAHDVTQGDMVFKIDKKTFPKDCGSVIKAYQKAKELKPNIGATKINFII